MTNYHEYYSKISLFLAMALIAYMAYIIPKNLRDDSDGRTAVCTVTGAYTKELGGADTAGTTNVSPIGIFTTEECGNLTMYEAPEGWKIPAYIATAQPGKKYLFHVANSSPKKERDFDTTLFEEIKE